MSEPTGTGGGYGAGYGPMPSDTGKLLAVIGYAVPIVAIVGLLMDPYRSEPFVRLHAIQALVLSVAWSLGWAIPIVGWIAAIGAFVLGILGFLKALQGEYYRMPVVYSLVASWVEQAPRGPMA